MALGYSVKGVCYADLADAASAYFSSIPPEIIITPTGIEKIVFYAGSVGGAWREQYQKTDFTGNSVVIYDRLAVFTLFKTNGVFYGSCTVPNDPETNFNDGLTLGWGVAAAMVVAYLIKRCYR